MKLFEVASYSKLKAGIIPFKSDGRGMFMVSSDAKYGGIRPAIAKGRVDEGENSETAAVREGEGELGLKKSNFKGTPFLVWSGKLTGLDASYPFDVYAVEVEDPNDFGEFHYETAKTLWMSAAEFTTDGRQSQNAIVQDAFKIIEKRLNR